MKHCIAIIISFVVSVSCHAQINTHIGLTSGVWLPQGDLGLLGSHPYAGVLIGAEGGKLMAGLNMSFRFRKSANYYTTMVDDTVYSTNHYNGFYFGADGAYSLAKTKRSEFALVGGIALEVLGTLRTSFAGDLTSVNLNSGIAYNFYVANQATRPSFLSLQAKYNFLFFNNTGTSLRGNALTVGLILVWCNKKDKSNKGPASPTQT
jgi:hypothetical protein